jgi:hypothetical protein
MVQISKPVIIGAASAAAAIALFFALRKSSKSNKVQID